MQTFTSHPGHRSALFDAMRPIGVDAPVRRASARTVIVLDGHVSRRAFLLDRGVVQLHLRLQGSRTMLYELVPAPAVLGLDTVLLGAVSPFLMTALTDVELRTVDVERLRGWAVDSHTWPLLHAAERGITLASRLRDQFHDVTRRVALLLASYADALPEVTNLPLNNERIAADLGIVTRTVSKAMATLQRAGTIHRTARGVYIANRPQLDQRAARNEP